MSEMEAGSRKGFLEIELDRPNPGLAGVHADKSKELEWEDKVGCGLAQASAPEPQSTSSGTLRQHP